MIIIIRYDNDECEDKIMIMMSSTKIVFTENCESYKEMLVIIIQRSH